MNDVDGHEFVDAYGDGKSITLCNDSNVGGGISSVYINSWTGGAKLHGNSVGVGTMSTLHTQRTANFRITSKLGTEFATGNVDTSAITALTLDTSQNATFAGDIMTGVTSTPSAGEAGTYLNAGGYTYSSRASTTKAPHFLISNNNGACGNIASNGTGEFLISSGTGQATALTLDNSQNAIFTACLLYTSPSPRD